ncbi:MAG: PIN domain-containing protein [Acidimicrobiaceae bacterium]|nr:PIN domain-containing protein [Acidimicrobiaceae bacterium]MDE0606796.1 PIN domain-containing protein [Acidimicrobiaceae bacterium]
MSVFVDTSAWYAAADLGDIHHDRAVERLSEFSGDLVTSDHVLVETWFLAANRLGFDTAETLIATVRSGGARVEVATIADLEIAAQIHDAFTDQEFSIVDRASWSIMQRLGVHEAISFDQDYFIYRFGRNRRQAFTVHT